MNPGKIVRASRMDDRALFRFKPDYRVPEMQTALDWSAYPGAGGGFQGAVEMCNNNGECRKHAADVMCPSFRVTGNERDVTRGRANSLRLAISGQLGPDALRLRRDAGDHEAVRLLQGLPARMPDRRRHGENEDRGAGCANKRRGLSLHDRLVAYLPRYAPYASRFAPLMNVRNAVPGARLAHRAPHRLLRQAPFPRWRRDVFSRASDPLPPPREGGGDARQSPGRAGYPSP